jgi:hypothetical protein
MSWFQCRWHDTHLSGVFSRALELNVPALLPFPLNLWAQSTRMVGNMISGNASKGRMIFAAKEIEAEIAARKEASAIIIAEQGR